MFAKLHGKHRVSKRHIVLLVICVAALDIAFVAFFYMVTVNREINRYVEYLIAVDFGVSTQMTSLGLFLERDAVHLSHDAAIKKWVSQANHSLRAEGGGKGGAETLEIRNALHDYLYSHFHWIKRMKKSMAKMPGMPGPMKKMRGFDQQHIQFVVAPENTSLLRTHEPEQFGDMPVTYRNLLKRAETLNNPLNGLDIDSHYAGLRGIAPITINGQNGWDAVVGYVEVGQSFEHILINLKDLLKEQQINIEFAVLLKKKAADTVMGNGSPHAARTCSGDYAVIAATSALPEVICGSKRFDGILEELPGGCRVKSEGQHYIVGAMPDPTVGLRSMKMAENKSDLAFVTWFPIAPQSFRALMLDKIWGALIFGGVSFLCLMAALTTLWHFASKKLNRLVDLKTAELADANQDLIIAKEDAESAKDQAEAANKAKSEFLANMSHEIRTPMNAIIGIGDLMSGTKLNSKQTDYLDMLRSSSRSLLGLLNDILDFSKIEADQLDLEHIAFRLRGLVEEVADNFRGKSAEKQIEFIVDIDPAAPDGLLGDPLRLKQVLINLMSNAFKFTEQGEIQLQVQVKQSTADKAALIFIVRDTGIGIEPAVRNNLFMAFTQADTSVSRRYGGTGLGLSISQRLVQMMSGAPIEIESEPGVGSRFQFEITFELAEAPDRREWIVPAELKDTSVLIIEGNQSSRLSLERAMSDFGLNYRSVGTAADALTTLGGAPSPQDFGLIIMDLKLPDMNGFQAVRKIREITALDKIPVILTSVYREEELLDSDQAPAICAYLLKPVRRSALFDAIMECLGFEQQKRPAADVTSFASHFQEARILLAEDNAANQMVASEILNNAGFSVEVAGSGTDALEKCLHKTYAAVLMDVQMPEMDGIEATVQIRKTLAAAKLPIIAMTANAMRGDRETCLAAGMNDYVSKPINSIELLNTLKKWIPETGADTSAADMDDLQPPTLTTEPPDNERPPASLPGIDIEEGLRRLGVSWVIFKKMLLEFKRSQPREVAHLREALAMKDYDRVRLKAHSLAGIGGNIAAVALKEACKSLEKAAQVGDNQKIATHWPELREEFERVTHGIAAIVESDETATAPLTAAAIDSIDLKALESALEELARCVEDFDPVGVESAMTDISEAGIPVGLESRYHDLNRKIKDLDYAAAAGDLAAMQKILHDITGK